MIPIRDAIRSNKFPVINILMIILNIVAFLWELVQGPSLEQTFFLYGIVPARYSHPDRSEGNRGDLLLEVRVKDYA